MNFKELDDLPQYDLQEEFDRLINENKISWYHIADQICLNSTIDDPDNIHLGRGSLIWDWDNFERGAEDTSVVKRRDKILKESDFVNLCSGFKDSLFEEVYNRLEKKYKLGRVRIMKSAPKTCLTWHVDHHPRIHYPIKTQEGCFMIIEDKIMHLPQNTWWWTNTLVKHTAINASKDIRLHLVATILEEK
jgi:hypothetical protein